MKKVIKDIKKVSRDTQIDLTRQFGPSHSGKPGIHQSKKLKKPKYKEDYLN